ncbi:S1C family serine protease [Blattabacterium cuenoti]|uniref:S1C family serine protease n=1 Tax=Blattabacterium cuenoti TaxID=1653831 RepID=UPI00163B66FA|nr:trypsin-like peptidase domain-containing protein [Blattabacterium cuenoti]
MRNVFFYVLLSSVITSFLSISIYRNYEKKEKKFLPWNPVYAFQKSQNIPLKTSLFSHSHFYFPDFTEIVQKNINAVVKVKNYSKRNRILSPFDFFFGFPDDFSRRKWGKKHDIYGFHGSGVLISSDGYIVTNHHVIHNAESIEVILNDQRIYPAQLIGSDPSTDVALIKIHETNLPFVAFQDSNQVQVGEWVIAIGNPFDLNATVTSGIISAKNRNIGILNEKASPSSSIESFFQTDAAVNPGNSGGPLLNMNGKLIGINTAISSSSGNFIGYSFAVPSNLVLKVVKDIKTYGSVQRAFLGVKGGDMKDIYSYLRNKNQTISKNFNVQQGFFIGEVIDHSSAYDAGLQTGDVIKRIDGHLINNSSDLIFMIGMKHPGDIIVLEIVRKKEIKYLSVVLKRIKK